MKKTVVSKAAKRAVARKAAAKSTPGIPAKVARPPVNQAPAARSAPAAIQPTRFAHPFFTPPGMARAAVAGVGTRMLDHIQGNLQSVPAPSRNPTMTLANIIGTKGSREVEASGSIRFHTVGDTGHSANSPQGAVADAMTTDFDISHPETSPAFFFHLGDVCYRPNKDQNYRGEFYEPYVHYPGKIVAIAGNHDGEVFANTDPVSLRAFMANFCAPSQKVPAIAGTIYRETMNLPGVYYLLDAPFVQIVAMYSNAAENPGFISGPIPGPAQKAWLLKTLKAIAAKRTKGTRKALVFATHHPPFTAGGHSSSIDMLKDIDDVCAQAGIQPDMFLSGHAHNYQRYTRNTTLNGKAHQAAYVVAGTGGISDQAVPPATKQKTGDHTYESSMKGYGYLLIEVNATSLRGTMFSVDPATHAKKRFETFTVDLVRHKVS